MVKNFVQVGFTRKTHGLQGELKASIEPNFIEDFLKAEVLYLDLKGKKVPFFLESVRGKGELIVKFEDVDDKDSAQPFSSKEIFLVQTDILLDAEREIPLQEDEDEDSYEYCTGYRIQDKTLGDVGEIAEVIELPQSEMAVLLRGKQEILIPLIPQFILHIDDEKKIVEMDLPEGLI